MFQDDELRALIRTALAGNTDVRIAASRVLQAQAVLGITQADAYPTVDGAVQAGGGRIAATDTAAARTAAAHPRRCDGPLGDRFLGQVPARHRSRARAAAGQRMGPARRRVQRRERGRAGLLRAALARSAAGDRAAHAHLAPGVAGADAGARARRRHLARRRPRGGAAGLRRRRDHRRARAPHRAAGEPDLGPDRRLPVAGDEGPRAGRAAAAAGRSRRPAVRPAGAAARHPAGRAGADRRQRADRRGAGRLLPEHRAHRQRRPPEHGAADADQHRRGCLDGGRRRRPADRHRRAHAIAGGAGARHGPRRRR